MRLASRLRRLEGSRAVNAAAGRQEAIQRVTASLSVEQLEQLLDEIDALSAWLASDRAAAKPATPLYDEVVERLA